MFSIKKITRQANLQKIVCFSEKINYFSVERSSVVCNISSAVAINRNRIKRKLWWKQVFNEKDPLYDTSMYVDGQTVRLVSDRSRIGKVKVVKQTVFEKEYNLLFLVPLDESQVEDMYYPNQLEVYC